MIHSFEFSVKTTGEVGRVEEAKDFLVKVSGLAHAKIGEGVTFETEEHGRVMAVGPDGVEVLLLSQNLMKPQTKVARTGSMLSISAGEGLLGHIINTLGHSLTSRRQKSHAPEKRAIEIAPSGISGRSRISRFFETGVALSDLLIPLGYGQRELIIGDRQSGKTHFLLQVVLSQVKLGRIVIYCLIGKRKSEIKFIDEFFEKHNITESTIIVASDAQSSPGEIYLAPYTGMTLAEYFRDQGNDVLVIFDDLTTHAKYYREIALLSGRFPGRESYPGDIFHIHSKLLERAGNFKNSITCLPVADTVGGDLTGYIQTNLMSMTDGHLYFDSDLYFQGKRPPINIFLSVTRVGRQTQSSLYRDIGFQLVRFLKRYDDIQRFIRFDIELSTEIQEGIQRGKQLLIFFNQIGYTLIPISVQAYIIGLIWLDRFEEKDIERSVNNYENKRTFKKSLDHICEKAKRMEELIKAVKNYVND